VAIPDYQSLMLPVLQEASSGEIRISDVVDSLGRKLVLTDDDLAETLPSGKQSTFSNRVHWAKTYLKQAGLVEATRRAHFRITDRGRQVIAEGIPKIDVAYLQKFSEFRAFRERATDDANTATVEHPTPAKSDQTPDDLMRKLGQEINNSLGMDIVDRIMNASPAFFERVVVRLLLAMGYGGSLAEAGKAIGKSGDDGIDGVIDQDTLGLDRIYIQAKRYKSESSIGSGAIRDFFGSLDMHKATKGLFVTTSSFSKSAVETAEKLGKRIVLIDGVQLAKLLVKFNVGCRLEDTVEIKKIDEDFFE
jgi:restriction system protein